MSHHVFYRRVPSPLGPLLLLSDGAALTGLFMESHKYGPSIEAGWVDDEGPLRSVQRQLEEYFAGVRTTFDVPLGARGTAFQREVWQALATIPYGETTTYADLARRIGRPSAVRAVGAANGRNPISIIVPCHRVVGTDGSLVGYGGGMDRKRQLLELEQAALVAAKAPPARLSRADQDRTVTATGPR
jgi:methylated-DNA-[protein]-cysteine S-methyltransferase